MGISFQHAIDVKQTPHNVFAVLEDFTLAPRWVTKCTGIEKLSPGKNRAGTKLRCSYREGGQTGTLDAEITARIANERLTFRCSEKVADVIVDFRISKASEGAHVEISIEVLPKTLAARLFSPMIRSQLPKETIAAMKKLRALISTKNEQA